MTSIIGGILSDCLGAKGLPAGAISAALGQMMKKRHAVLREVVMAELRQGNFENIDEEELISVFFRLIRSAEEGVARNNLRLMARVINGMAEKQELKAPTFLKYANILASLTEEETIALATLIYHRNVARPNDRIDLQFRKRGVNFPEPVLQALLRTGLVMVDLSGTGMADNLLAYRLTALMDDLLKFLPSFEELSDG